MFFVISGIVIPLSMIKSEYKLQYWGKFLLKRFARLEPPYIAGILIAIAYFQIRKFIPGTSSEDMMITYKELLLHLGYMVPFVEGARWAVPSLWTLSIEFQYYLLLSLIFPFALRYTPARWMLYTLFLLFPLILPNHALFPSHAPLFLLGIVYALWYTKSISGVECCIIIVLALTASLIFMPVSFSIVAALTLAVVHFATDYNNRWLAFLGMISYSLYLLHQSTGSAVINFLSHRFREDYQKPIVILIGYAVSIACSFIIYKLIELPSLRLSKSIRYTTANSPEKHLA